MPSYNNNYYNPYILNDDYLSDIINYSSASLPNYKGYNLRERRQLDPNLKELPSEWNSVPDGQPISYQNSNGVTTNISKRNGEYYIGDNKLDKQGAYNSGYTAKSVGKGIGDFFSDKENQHNLLFDTLGVVGSLSNRSYMRKALRDQQRRRPDGYTNIGYNDNYIGFAESNYGETGLEADDSYGQWNYYEAPQEEMPDIQEEDHDIYSHDDFWDEPFSLEGEASNYFNDEGASSDEEDIPNFLTSYKPRASSNKEEIYNYLKYKGLPSHVAQGITANLGAESSYDPNAVGDEGKARGLAQWHPDRYKALASKGFNLRTLHGQLDGLLHELNTTENDAYRKLLKTKTPEEATDTFMIHFERPRDKTPGRRYNYLK